VRYIITQDGYENCDETTAVKPIRRTSNMKYAKLNLLLHIRLRIQIPEIKTVGEKGMAAAASGNHQKGKVGESL
jgi:hypothetical protein